MENFLSHVGTSHLVSTPGSGRYEYGSGENPNQHHVDFYSDVHDLRKKGYSDNQIAESMGMSLNKFRQKYSNADKEYKMLRDARIKQYKERGYSEAAIAEKIGCSVSTVNNVVRNKERVTQFKTEEIGTVLKDIVEKKKFVDVTKGAELYLDCTENRLHNALDKLSEDGYSVHEIYVPQATNPGKNTTLHILAKNDPSMTVKEQKKYILNNLGEIGSVEDFTEKLNGKTREGFIFPAAFERDRIEIRYPKDGGADLDGIIELRRGVPELDLGKNYAQVRIMTDNGYYLKGVAIYSDNMPKGKDIVFNTSKPDGAPDSKVFKELKKNKDGTIDRDNPFGSAIKQVDGQSTYIDKNGKEQLSVINKVNDEGDWDKWSRTLSAQFLSKQPLSVINERLTATRNKYEQEYADIMALTNSEVKRKLLADFASTCDSAAMHLKADGYAGQSQRLILPSTDLKENEVYAPTYDNGTEVILIRYPHSGKFEIPRLTVNNKNKKVLSNYGDLRDAIVINPKAAQQLSGADFDGDTVTVIPIRNGIKFATDRYLDELSDFDPRAEYPEHEGMKLMTKHQRQLEMGKVTNLIADMTMQDPTEDELARAVKHSMVVIDAYKHHLDYKQSELDNGIAALKERYQRSLNDGAGGAATLITRSKASVYVNERKDFTAITKNNTDPETGKKIVRETGAVRVKYDKVIDPVTGEEKRVDKLDIYGNPVTEPKQSRIHGMDSVDDAMELVSGLRHPVELAYAQYANGMKALANNARKEYLATERDKVDKTASETFAAEVASLRGKLLLAEKNAPKEHLAQIRAAQVVKEKKQAAGEELDKEELTKIGQRALASARESLGAHKQDVLVEITPREWEAIQAHAIPASTLERILNNTNMDKVRQYATPKEEVTISESKQNRIARMRSSGNYTIAEIANAVGVSVSTVRKYS